MRRWINAYTDTYPYPYTYTYTCANPNPGDAPGCTGREWSNKCDE